MNQIMDQNVLPDSPKHQGHMVYDATKELAIKKANEKKKEPKFPAELDDIAKTVAMQLIDRMVASYKLTDAPRLIRNGIHFPTDDFAKIAMEEISKRADMFGELRYDKGNEPKEEYYKGFFGFANNRRKFSSMVDTVLWLTGVSIEGEQKKSKAPRKEGPRKVKEPSSGIVATIKKAEKPQKETLRKKMDDALIECQNSSAFQSYPVPFARVYEKLNPMLEDLVDDMEKCINVVQVKTTNDEVTHMTE